LQHWLATGERNVVVPFAEQLADRVLALAVRQRRDFGALLTLIRAHALLHRGSRSRNEAGSIVATVQDYAVVRALVADLFSEGIEATVPATVRETVDALVTLKKDELSLGELAAKLALDKSVTSRRLRQATELGYLVNRETRRGRPARIVLGGRPWSRISIPVPRARRGGFSAAPPALARARREIAHSSGIMRMPALPPCVTAAAATPACDNHRAFPQRTRSGARRVYGAGCAAGDRKSPQGEEPAAGRRPM
jgi:hypothetical protein